MKSLSGVKKNITENRDHMDVSLLCENPCYPHPSYPTFTEFAINIGKQFTNLHHSDRYAHPYRNRIRNKSEKNVELLLISKINFRLRITKWMIIMYERKSTKASYESIINSIKNKIIDDLFMWFQHFNNWKLTWKFNWRLQWMKTSGIVSTTHSANCQ